MTDNSILARAKALVDEADRWMALHKEHIILRKCVALLRDIIAALEGPDDAEKLVRWARECEASGHMEVYRDQLCDLIERQRLRLAEAKADLETAIARGDAHMHDAREAERKLREAGAELARWRPHISPITGAEIIVGDKP